MKPRASNIRFKQKNLICGKLALKFGANCCLPFKFEPSKGMFLCFFLFFFFVWFQFIGFLVLVLGRQLAAHACSFDGDIGALKVKPEAQNKKHKTQKSNSKLKNENETETVVES